MRNCIDSLCDIIKGVCENILVEKPCKIINVHSPYLVDVEYFSKNKANVLYNVPVKHLQTSESFICLGLNVGDCGTVRFFDDDIEGYLNSTDEPSNESRTHNINDNLFSLGFYPKEQSYVLPEGDVVIGTTSGELIQISSAGITVSGSNIKLNADSVSISSNTVIDGVSFLDHTHSSGHDGAPTGAVIV